MQVDESATSYNIRTFKMTLAYDGTHYAGWQVQPNRQTVQGMLEKAIGQICHERTRVTGSGRTDSGVHALAQVASFSLNSWRASPGSLMRALNSKLPPDISIGELAEAPIDFHAIRDAVGKRYRYQIQIGGTRNAFEHRYHWYISNPIDVVAMRQAIEFLRGQHDFASFQAAGSDRKTTVRHVRDLVIQEPAAIIYNSMPDSDRSCPARSICQNNTRAGQGWVETDALRIAIEIEADGFLYNMVRNIVGTLVEIGQGKHPAKWAYEVLTARDRKAAGPTAPPHGLFLLWVKYANAKIQPADTHGF
jgi:tRNA pseudouridine38-40 synthase